MLHSTLILCVSAANPAIQILVRDRPSGGRTLGGVEPSLNLEITPLLPHTEPTSGRGWTVEAIRRAAAGADDRHQNFIFGAGIAFDDAEVGSCPGAGFTLFALRASGPRRAWFSTWSL